MTAKKPTEQDTDNGHWLTEESEIIPDLIDTEITLDITKRSYSISEILESNEVLPRSNISPNYQANKFSAPSIVRSLVNIKKIELRNI